VDVQELARTGSINGQALWGVRVREMAKGPNPKLPKVEGGGDFDGRAEGGAREQGERLRASMSAIQVWDAGEVARELRSAAGDLPGPGGAEDRREVRMR
jgi:hypothetical protein